jgi:hypothetical protein
MNWAAPRCNINIQYIYIHFILPIYIYNIYIEPRLNINSSYVGPSELDGPNDALTVYPNGAHER